MESPFCLLLRMSLDPMPGLLLVWTTEAMRIWSLYAEQVSKCLCSDGNEVGESISFWVPPPQDSGPRSQLYLSFACW